LVALGVATSFLIEWLIDWWNTFNIDRSTVDPKIISQEYEALGAPL